VQAEEAAPAAPAPHAFQVGSRVEGNFGGLGDWYPGVIQLVHQSPPEADHVNVDAAGTGAVVGATVDVAYDDGDSENAVPLERLRLLG
jgi:hypothetical protein